MTDPSDRTGEAKEDADANAFSPEDALGNTGEMLRLLTKNMSDMIRVTDLQGANLYVSPSHLKGLGYEPEELLGKNSFATIHPDDFRDVINAFFEGIAEGIQPWRTEYRAMHAKGHYVWLETVADFLNDARGRPMAFVFCSRDISARRQIEEKLLHRESCLSAIIDNLPGPAWLKDREGRYLTANRAFAVTCGMQSGDDIAGMTDYDLWPGEMAKNLRAEDFKVMQTGSSMIIEQQIPVKGGPRWFESFKAPVRDAQENTIGTTGYAREVTERKKAERESFENFEKFRILADNSTDVIWTMDLEGRMTYISPSITQVAGYSQEEVVGNSMANFLHPEDLPAVLENIRSELQKPREERIDRKLVEVRHLSKDGSLLDTEISASWLYDRDGEVIGIQGSTRDISARRKMEEERTRLEKQLLHAQKMEAIGTLAGGIAHDINNMLTTIQGYVTLMQVDIRGYHPDSEKLEKISEQIRSGANLTSQLLGFARGGKYEIKTCDPNELLKRSSDVFGRTKKEVSITLKLYPGVWAIDVDPVQIEQTLFNMFINSWQAMPDGGDLYLVTNNIVLDESAATPHGVKPGRYVTISITDTGVGMDDETRKRIFEPFFTTKALGQGTGLGLASSYGIIKNHDGFIAVKSEMGKGSTFRIYLPASDKKAVAEEAPAASRSARGVETILIVDDEQAIIEVTKELLEAKGFRVMAAGSGQEAVAVYREKKDSIDLIILDMIMPGLGGSKTYDQLFAIDPGVKILLASGYSIDGEAQRIIDKGCKGFIQKPFRINELAHKIREII
jgi:PAS domain S-box-containing protein